MRHGKKVKKLGRTRAHRKAMLSNLASSLILNEYIVTTEAKSKECKSFVDKLISIGKDKSLPSKRRVKQLLGDKLAVNKLMDVLADRYKDRTGGVVSMVRLGYRKGDDAPMVKLVLVGSKPFRKVKKVRTKKAEKSKGKGEKTKEERKKVGVLDRVKEIRKKFADRGREGKVKGREGVDKGVKEGGLRSRSGI